MREVVALLLFGCAQNELPLPPTDELVELRTDHTTSDDTDEKLGTHASDCAECHAAHFGDWSSSRHASAFVGELFQREWAAERQALCLTCHAPNAEDPSAPRHEEATRGVDCATCHIVDGVVRAATVSGEAPHESRAAPELATTAVCAPCHQVGFPDQPELPLQDTVHEWQDAAEPAGACQTCHMPATAARHRHDFVGGHDAKWIADALRIETELIPHRSRTLLVMTLHNEGAGHAIPTGDIFRRLAIRAWPTRVDYLVRERELGRHFDTREGLWRPLDDDRLPAGGSQRIELEFPRRVDEIQWSIEMRSIPRALENDILPREHAPRLLQSGTTSSSD